MTSNTGSAEILSLEGRTDGDSYGRVKQKGLGLLKQAFRPQFLNRVDETVVFHALDKSEPVRIVDIQLARLRGRLLDKRIELEVTEAAKRLLAEAGYDPVYGARPIKRTIQRSLETEIARHLLSGGIEEGKKRTVDLSGGELRSRSGKEALAVASQKPPKKIIPGRRCGGHLPGLASRLGSDANAFSGLSCSKECAMHHGLAGSCRLKHLRPDTRLQAVVNSKMKSRNLPSVFNNETGFHHATLPPVRSQGLNSAKISI